MDDGANIIEFSMDPRARRVDYPLTAKRNLECCGSGCKRVAAIEKTRLCECLDCGRTIDPFDYLIRWAREGDRRLSGLRQMDMEIEDKGKTLEQLKGQIRNARAQLRRAKNHSLDLMEPPAPRAEREGCS